MKTALVLGAGGFIGSHIVKRLKSEGYWVRGVDIKEPEFSKSESDEFLLYDLSRGANVSAVMRLDYAKDYLQPFSFLPQPFCDHRGFDEVYQFAADMGGAGYVFTGEHDADIMTNSALINLHVCDWSRLYKPGKVFYSSSACMYPQYLQNLTGRITGVISGGLKEDHAYPANPDSEYGWEKLFSERLYLAFARNHGLNVRIARFHNIYGPEGTYKGGKEKAPAAMCRKAIEADGEMEIWGDGEQTRSFLYIDDCIEAVRRLMDSNFEEPINIGSAAMVTINQLADIAIELSGKTITKKHIEGPQGVRGRNSDNTLARQVLGNYHKYSLYDGMTKTFAWIKSQFA